MDQTSSGGSETFEVKKSCGRLLKSSSDVNKNLDSVTTIPSIPTVGEISCTTPGFH